MKRPLWLLLLAPALAICLIITNLVAAQAEFQVSELRLSSQSVKVGEPVTITATITNNGNQDGTYNLTLKINDEIKESKEITLAAGKSQTVSFTVTAENTGDQIVELDGATDFFTVQSSFGGMFPPYLWIIVGAIVGVLILLVIVMLVMPPGKKQPKGGKTAKTKGGGKTAFPPPSPSPFPTTTPFPGVDQHTMPGTMAAPMQAPMQTPMQGPQQMPLPPRMQPGVQPPTPATGHPPMHAPSPFPMPGPMAPPRPPGAGRPIFNLRNLTITPTQVKQGDPVTISVIVANNGAEHGRYSVVLRIDGVAEGITEIDMPPGTSQHALFTVTKDEPGTYYVEVDGLAGTFTSIALVPANFSVTNLEIAPDRVRQGEYVTISAVVTNTGEITGSYSLVLKLKGVAESIQEVTLGPGVSQRVAFNVVKDAAGFYNVELEGLTGRFVVEMDWTG
ncbi:MAG: hypothetical protein FJZ94_06610 [Chloroflexi bacterium]|nr:hypothetical protein [Chloroflexota bacterium]